MYFIVGVYYIFEWFYDLVFIVFCIGIVLGIYYSCFGSWFFFLILIFSICFEFGKEVMVVDDKESEDCCYFCSLERDWGKYCRWYCFDSFLFLK